MILKTKYNLINFDNVGFINTEKNTMKIFMNSDEQPFVYKIDDDKSVRMKIITHFEKGNPVCDISEFLNETRNE